MGFTEAAVRAMRDRVMLHTINDVSWNAVRSNWLEPSQVQWLKEHSRIELRGQYRPPES